MTEFLYLMLGLVIVCLFIIFLIIKIYNKLIKLRNRYQNAFSQIDVQLTRRYELIPNLIEVAKKFMGHERETLEAVINARNNAQEIKVNLGGNPTDGAQMQELLKAEGVLGKSMGSFFALAESYPDLKSDNTMTNLMEELTSTENKVGFARQNYNDSVTEYNIAMEEFPSNFIAVFFRFTKATLFEVDSPEVKKAIKVSFD